MTDESHLPFAEQSLRFRLRKRAEIRRASAERKSVREGRPDRVADLLEEAATKLEALEAFKAFVHRRLDEAGVPVDPPGEHRDAGCRIGQRLDLVLPRWRSFAPLEIKFTDEQEEYLNALLRASQPSGLRDRIIGASIAACNCGTKTPELVHHHLLCRFRVLQEAIFNIAPPPSPPPPMTGEEIVAAFRDPPTVDEIVEEVGQKFHAEVREIMGRKP